MKRRTLYLATTACFFVLQLLVIGSVIVKGNLVIARGVECRFKATGYDPSDPIRGRYVRFSAEVETMAIDEALATDEALYVGWSKAYFQLSETPDESGLTQVLRCAAEPSEDGLWIGPVRTYITFSLSWNDQQADEKLEDFVERRKQSPKVARAELPEKFYAPEAIAPELENRLRADGASAVAVYRAYKGSILLVDFQVTP
ncbi:MAG: GDYXXLXY domain-containing protein [Victivallales bacterium]|nr:GDYXXLXY domain-containing protein [Victivallales bacterium]MBR0458344.1 GDYXXLXY domain-containing protein [Victivallales bacterium]